MKTRPSDYLNTVQLLNQLVEEAAELASAASKMIRIIDGANPTPVTPEAGWKKLLEESADVQVCLGEILSIADWERVAHTREEKENRWMQRLEEKDNNETAL